MLPVMLIPGACSSGGISTLSLPKDKSTTEKRLLVCPQQPTKTDVPEELPCSLETQQH